MENVENLNLYHIKIKNILLICSTGRKGMYFIAGKLQVLAQI